MLSSSPVEVGGVDGAADDASLVELDVSSEIELLLVELVLEVKLELISELESAVVLGKVELSDVLGLVIVVSAITDWLASTPPPTIRVPARIAVVVIESQLLFVFLCAIFFSFIEAVFILNKMKVDIILISITFYIF